MMIPGQAGRNRSADFGMYFQYLIIKIYTFNDIAAAGILRPTHEVPHLLNLVANETTNLETAS